MLFLYSCPVHEACYHGTALAFRTALAGNFYTAMNLGKPAPFDMLKLIKEIPKLRNTPRVISRFKALVPGPQNLLSWLFPLQLA